MQASFPTSRATAQRGGTFLGIILGVLLGLGAALAVAVYVTKIPMPFMSKSPSVKSSAEQDAAEAQKNKNWDPNTPLYGKNPGKPSASGSVGTATATSTPATPSTPPAPPVATASAPKAATAAPKVSSSDPLGDLAKAKSASPSSATSNTTSSASASASAEPLLYFVQAGAYRNSEDAEAQKVKLAMAGFEAKITEREQSGRTVFRVRIGPFDKREEVDKAKEKLDAGGFEAAVVRVQR